MPRYAFNMTAARAGLVCLEQLGAIWVYHDTTSTYERPRRFWEQAKTQTWGREHPALAGRSGDALGKVCQRVACERAARLQLEAEKQLHVPGHAVWRWGMSPGPRCSVGDFNLAVPPTAGPQHISPTVAHLHTGPANPNPRGRRRNV